MSGLVRRAKKGFLDADIDLLVDNIKAVLVDLTDLIGTHCRAITGATNATPIVVTCTAHGFTNGDVVSISGVGGNTNANGLRKIKNQATNTFELTDLLDVNIAGNAAYTSGGFAVNLSTIDFLDDVVSGARCAISGNLANKTTTAGTFDFDDFTWTAVATGDIAEAVFFYDDTPATEATKPLICIDDSATNLPVTTNGGNIQYQVNASGLFDL